MASLGIYNNGILVVADEIHLGTTRDGGPDIRWLKGMQIVHGGQTTASIYFTKKKIPEADLAGVRVPTKIIVLRIDEDGLISDISRYANSQNSVKLSDLFANKPFQVQIEQMALSTYCPDGIGRRSTNALRAATTQCSHAKAPRPPGCVNSGKRYPPAARSRRRTWPSSSTLGPKNRRQSVFGSQKNFERVMAELTQDNPPLPDVQW